MKTENVCVIDDDIVYQFTAKKILSGMQKVGKILVFSDGEEAYNYLNEHLNNSKELPDIIFLDINMPYMDGWTFIDTYKRLKPRLNKPITIYMVSSSHEKTDVKRARSIGEISGYIVKPITKEIFEEKIDQLFSN